ncbi:MAG: SecD/SecF fusion protein [Crocinitomix sp.]|jgi:SecD/SecF fusion protein
MKKKRFFSSINIALMLTCLCQLSFIYPAKTNAGHLGFNSVESEDTESNFERGRNNGIRVILEVSILELVADLAGNPRNQEFKAPLNIAFERANLGDGNFIDLFVTEFEKLNEGVLLSRHFYMLNMHELSENSSNEEILIWLKDEALHTLDHTRIILEARAHEFGLGKPIFRVEPETNRIIIDLPGISDSESVRKNLQATANFGFYEVYDNKTNGIAGIILQREAALSEALYGKKIASNDSKKIGQDSILSDEDNEKKHPISSLLNLAFKFNESGEIIDYQEGSVIAYAHIKDTAELNLMLNHDSIRSTLPRGLVFMWDAQEIENGDQPTGTFALHAIKVPLNGPKVDDRDIERASINKRFEGQFGLDLQMNEIGAMKWKEMTSENLNRQIAIIMDQSVLSAPYVNQVMDINSSITGDFTLAEVRELAALINAGPFPIPVKIVQIDKL